MNAMDTVTLILAALATARITRIVTTDRITQAPRTWLLRKLVEKYGGDHLLPYLVVCDWCVSIYVGSGAALAWWAWGGTEWFAVVCAALSFSHVTGALARMESE